MSNLLSSPRGRQLLTLAVLLSAPWAAAAAGEPAPVQKYALLVGCTQYPERPLLRGLRGPANDVPMWARVLTDPRGFQFPPENVTQLVGWPDRPERRPTYANIVKGFEDLVARSGPDVQVFILLSGHGMTVPLPDDRDPLDPKHYKPEGLDEVFLPADVKNVPGGIANVLMDYEVGGYLDKMRARKASVWIVFDCCHAGDMTRGGDKDVREVSRVADPALFGITPDQVDRAVKRAAEAVRKAGTVHEKKPLVRPSTKEQGSLVAFYAAQSFEEAPELPLPEGAPQVSENYYGLFSYNIVQALQQRRSPVSYRELARLVAVHYRGTRGTRPPTPFAEGDLDREVLGLNVWPKRADVVVERADDKLRLNVGALYGLTPGSVLALHPPAGDARDAREVLGYVRVESLTPTSASVAPCAFEGRPALAAEAVPDQCRGELVSRDFGDMRVKLFADDTPALGDALKKMAKRVRDMVVVVHREADAEWVLRAVTPAGAQASYGLKGLDGDHVLLLQGAGKRAAAPEQRPAAGPGGGTPKVFGTYPTARAEALGAPWSATCRRSSSGRTSGASRRE